MESPGWVKQLAGPLGQSAIPLEQSIVLTIYQLTELKMCEPKTGTCKYGRILALQQIIWMNAIITVNQKQVFMNRKNR